MEYEGAYDIGMNSIVGSFPIQLREVYACKETL